MKILPIFILIFVSFSAYGQKVLNTEKVTDHSIYVKGTNFEGVIFSLEYDILFASSIQNKDRFTPTIEEIEQVEYLLNEKLKDHNSPQINQGGSLGPVIHKRLRKYQRQYIGRISESGEKIIHVNMIWQRHNLIDKIRGYDKPGDRWKKDWLEVLDGGSYYWNIKVKLDSKELTDLMINGVA